MKTKKINIKFPKGTTIVLYAEITNEFKNWHFNSLIEALEKVYKDNKVSIEILEKPVTTDNRHPKKCIICGRFHGLEKS